MGHDLSSVIPAGRIPWTTWPLALPAASLACGCPPHPWRRRWRQRWRARCARPRPWACRPRKRWKRMCYWDRVLDDVKPKWIIVTLHFCFSIYIYIHIFFKIYLWLKPSGRSSTEEFEVAILWWFLEWSSMVVLRVERGGTVTVSSQV